MSDDKKKGRPRFWWWKINDLIDEGLFDAMFRPGWRDHLKDEMIHGRLEHRPHDGAESLILIDEEGTPCGEYNNSHECPIDCP